MLGRFERPRGVHHLDLEHVTSGTGRCQPWFPQEDSLNPLPSSFKKASLTTPASLTSPNRDFPLLQPELITAPTSPRCQINEN